MDIYTSICLSIYLPDLNKGLPEKFLSFCRSLHNLHLESPQMEGFEMSIYFRILFSNILLLTPFQRTSLGDEMRLDVFSILSQYLTTILSLC